MLTVIFEEKMEGFWRSRWSSHAKRQKKV